MQIPVSELYGSTQIRTSVTSDKNIQVYIPPTVYTTHVELDDLLQNLLVAKAFADSIHGIPLGEKLYIFRPRDQI